MPHEPIQIPWLSPSAKRLAALSADGRAPQSLLIHGPAGIGRRHLALWHAAGLLGARPANFLALLEQEPTEDDDAGEIALVHPDFMLLRPAAEKQVISIDAIRRLINFLHLKSHQGGGRAAVLWPAEAMTVAAANSLLKTLEEPPPGATLILVASLVSRLPATIRSRCQRLRMAAPARTTTLPWLQQQSPDADWPALLDLAGDAPFTALDSHRQGHSALHAELLDDLHQLSSRADTPAAVAARWAKRDPQLTLRWLYRRASAELRKSALATPGEVLQSGDKGLNMRHRQNCLQEIEFLLRTSDKSMNFELQLAALLQHWNRTGHAMGDAR